MQVGTEVVDGFLRDGALPDSWLLDVAAGDGEPPVTLQLPTAAQTPLVAAVRDEVLALLDPFIPGHEPVWDAVFGDWPGALADARVAVTVGWPAPYDAGVRTDPDGEPVIVIDAARVSSYGAGTRRTIVRTLLDHELAHLAIARRWPGPPGAGYRERLEHVTFDEGLAHYLAMRGSPAVDLTRQQTRDRQSAAHASLRDALAETDPERQRELLVRGGAAGGFWDKFAAVAGMLGCADAEACSGTAGLARLVEGGWIGFAERLPG